MKPITKQAVIGGATGALGLVIGYKLWHHALSRGQGGGHEGHHHENGNENERGEYGPHGHEKHHKHKGHDR